MQDSEAQRRDQALESNLRRHADSGDHDQRAQIAAAEQHQGARGAGVCRDHAVAEQQPAEQHQRCGERRLQIDRLAEIDHAARRQELRAGNRHRQRQREAAHQAAVALRPPIAQAAGQAKAADEPDGTEDEADEQAGKEDDIWDGGHERT